MQTIRTWGGESSAGGVERDGKGDGERLIDALSGASSSTVNKVTRAHSRRVTSHPPKIAINLGLPYLIYSLFRPQCERL